MIYRLERVTFIPRSKREVFAFFSEAHNLERITPPFLKFHILTPGPIAMQAGTLIDYELTLHGLQMRWRTRIEEFVDGSYFADVQLKGPYRMWRHRHDFEDAEGGTQMTDRVGYELPFGPLGQFARWLFVRRQVEQIFNYRNEVIVKEFGSAAA
ncbi:SRPBCC family protein [Terracidiphilus gabretensis]|uniref:SRPBCC family protein n=1 Tax=Terracidiphilus gabretensis TaxID=1577687 RepID=UPI00071B2A44|nr:SRPBCC family protein [Terracidiphilus gabretensis]